MAFDPVIEAKVDLLKQYYYSRPFNEKLQALYHQKVREFRAEKQPMLKLIIREELIKELEGKDENCN